MHPILNFPYRQRCAHGSPAPAQGRTRRRTCTLASIAASPQHGSSRARSPGLRQGGVAADTRSELIGAALIYDAFSRNHHILHHPGRRCYRQLKTCGQNVSPPQQLLGELLPQTENIRKCVDESTWYAPYSVVLTKLDRPRNSLSRMCRQTPASVALSLARGASSRG